MRLAMIFRGKALTPKSTMELVVSSGTNYQLINEASPLSRLHVVLCSALGADAPAAAFTARWKLSRERILDPNSRGMTAAPLRDQVLMLLRVHPGGLATACVLPQCGRAQDVSQCAEHEQCGVSLDGLPYMMRSRIISQIVGRGNWTRAERRR